MPISGTSLWSCRRLRGMTHSVRIGDRHLQEKQKSSAVRDRMADKGDLSRELRTLLLLWAPTLLLLLLWLTEHFSQIKREASKTKIAEVDADLLTATPMHASPSTQQSKSELAAEFRRRQRMGLTESGLMRGHKRRQEGDNRSRRSDTNGLYCCCC